VLIAGVLAGASTAAAQQAAAIQALYEEARREGEVIVWGTQQRDMNWIPRAFAERFPGVAVKVAVDGEIATRAANEGRSGRYEVDALWTSVPAAALLVQRRLATAIDWPMFGVSPDDLGFDGQMGFTNNNVYVVAYSAEHSKDADVPGAWADLADSRFAGKLVASLYSLPPVIGALGQAWGEERALQYSRDLLNQAEILVTRGPRDAFLKSGERPYAVAEIDSLARLWGADGLPIRYKVPEPVIAAQFGILPMANAPHPNAARLLAGWLASREGKAARERAAGSIDYRAGSSSELARRLHASGAKIIFDSAEEVRAREAIANRATLILTGMMR
jgi:iron(III) transport system substrate-binding protein